MKRHRQALTERRIPLVSMSDTGPQEECTALFLATVAISEKDYRNFPTCLSDLRADRPGDLFEIVTDATGPHVRCIFGNPFRPVAFDPSWLTSDVRTLAEGIYQDRAFDRMPVLADALQDAGCDSDDILSHCRDPQQVHVRGCWVVDSVLGKR
jgi:hypothetical protein